MSLLEEIIHKECLPASDCMLTVQDSSGETGFLYFKEGEIIEANYAALWGKEALAQIKDWDIAEHNINSLPLGIKRSLWDSLEALLASDTSLAESEGSSITPHFSTANSSLDSTPYQTLSSMPGVTKIVKLEQGDHEVIYEKDPEMVTPTEWIQDFLVKAKGVGDTLGLGKLNEWSIHTNQYFIVGLKRSGSIIGVVRKYDPDIDEFAAQCQSSLTDF